MRIATIVGARPQFIKAAVVSRALKHAGIHETLVHTGQHFDASMSDVFFRELDLPAPTHHLGIGGMSHGAMTGRMLEAIEGILEAERPEWALVYGDTNSTLAGALAAAKLHVPVAHVEAGMRSFNRRMPEELNRILADHLATLNLVTNSNAAKLLAAEGISRGVTVVGDVMLDACLLFRDAARQTGARAKWALGSRPFALATVHRAENTDDSKRLRGIMGGLEAVGRELPVVLALHPRTRGALGRAGIVLRPELVRVIDPVGYLEMLDLQQASSLILTDSGGVQKEAFFNQVPCVTLRDETEWVETVDLGWNALAGASAEAIEAAARRMLAATRSPPPEVYGDGHAAERIVDSLSANVAERPAP